MLTAEAVAPAVEAIQKAVVDGGPQTAATLYIEQDGFVFQQAFGSAPGPDAVFLISSLTKPMTAMGVMILADRGQISIDDRVIKYLPEFRGEARPQVTIRQLLSHTSGLPDKPESLWKLIERRAREEAFVELACVTPLEYLPGTKARYQSMGYILLGEIIQRVSGMPLRAFLRKEIFLPLAMSNSALGLGSHSLASVMVTPIDLWNSAYYRDLGSAWAGVHSSAADVATVLSITLAGRCPILSSEAIAEMVRNQTQEHQNAFGLGWMLGAKRFGGLGSEGTFGHHGATGTIAWADPRNGLRFVLLTTLPMWVSPEFVGLSRKTLLKPVSALIAKAALA